MGNPVHFLIEVRVQKFGSDKGKREKIKVKLAEYFYKEKMEIKRIKNINL